MAVSRTSRDGAFVSYSRADGEAIARELVTQLAATAPELRVWMDRFELEGGVGWWRQVEEQLDQVEFLILVMTPAAMNSENTRREWRAARQRGVCVYPIKGLPDSQFDYTLLPRWMRKAHFYDPSTEWAKLVAHLRRGCAGHRVPFMAPSLPPAFVSRPRELAALEQNLLGDDPSGKSVVLRGPGGYGKTSLAAALCLRDGVIEAFDDGILWVTLGQAPDLRAELLKLYAAVTGERTGFVDVDDAARELALRLQDKNCLVVIDDAWNVAHVRPFLHAQGPRYLITTRIFEVALGAERIDLGLMDPDDAVQLLLRRAEVDTIDLEPYHALARRLGGWPLTLKLAGAAMRQRLARGDTPERALQYVGRALDRHGLVAFDRNDATTLDATVEATLRRSLDLLDEVECRRYAELSIFPEGMPIPLSAVGKLWPLDEFDTEELARRLDELALADFDLRFGTLALHGVLRSLMVTRLGDAAASAHARLVDAWSPLPPDGYAWRWLIFHLRGAGHTSELRARLLDPKWLIAKLAATDIYALASDFDKTTDDLPLRLIRDALRLAAPALHREPGQLALQLGMRLMARGEPELVALCATLARMSTDVLWPLHQSFDAPGGVLAMTLLGPERDVLSLAWTANGEQLLSVGNDQMLHVWSREGLPLSVLTLPATGVRCVAVDAAARLAFCGSSAGRLIEVDLRQGEVLSKFYDDPRRAVDAVVLSGDGRRAATAGRGADVHVWDLAANAVVMRLSTRGGRVQALALSADGHVLVAGVDDGTVQRWDFTTGTPLRGLTAHTAAVTSVATSADGRVVLSGSSDRSLCVWDSSANTVRHLRGHEASINTVDMSPDGLLALSGASNRVMNVWRLADGSLLHQVVAHADEVHAVRFGGSSDWAASASADHSIRLWNFSEFATERSRDQHDGAVCALAFSADSRLCASGGSEGRIKLWEVASGQCIATLGIAAGTPIQSLAFTPDDRCVVSGSTGGHYRLWFIDSGESVWIPVRHNTPVDHAVFSANARFLVTSCPDRYVYFWDVSSGSLVARYGTRRLFDHLIRPSARRALAGDSAELLDTYLPGEPVFQVQGIALSDDGQFAAISGQPTWPGGQRSNQDGSGVIGEVAVLSFDIASGAIETVSTEQVLPVRTLAITTSGEMLTWVGQDHVLRLSGPGQPRLFTGHQERVRGVVVAAERGLLISCSLDHSVRAWRLLDARPAASLIGDSPMHALALSPDQSVVAVGDQLGRVHLLGLGDRAREREHASTG
ncbi:TIR domain-containing protein [Paucibacter sp. R3-3]|uniref:TIR domain-containing protein n=2 Tax=Roseateles agri TaxID=3098619 RepID=A0ABU5DMT7_9BURK|nr:TIR domain-containing protein [Paucibacter sp. R3-3]